MAYDRVVGPGDEWLFELRDRKVLWVIPLIAVLYFVWLLWVLSTADPPLLSESGWVWLGTGLFVVMIAFEVLLLVKTRTRPVVYPGTETPPGGEAGEVPPPKGFTRQDRDIVNWPEDKRQGGLYVTNHLRMADDLVLRKRTFAVRPCAFCEFRESCYEQGKYHERMDDIPDRALDEEEFLEMHGCTYGMDWDETL